MPITSLKLPDELKQRAATAARELGISTDVFMVEAIRLAVNAIEKRSEFLAEALAARAELIQNGLGHEADAVSTYLRSRIAQKEASRPDPERWRK